MASPATDEKSVERDTTEGSGSFALPALAAAKITSDSLDEAIIYLEKQGETSLATDDVDHAALVRKIDRHLIPIALAVYTLQFLDKFDLNYAAIMGLNAQLGLVGNDFNNIASGTYIASLIFEIPTGYILQKVPAGKWLGFNLFGWGLVTACTAAVTNYHGMLACRIFIGILEAATPPCLMVITSMWYTKSEAITRFAIWYCGLGLAQMLGAIISFGFVQVVGQSLSGWRIMFVVLGCITVVAGLWCIIWMPDSPMRVSWLTEAEKRVAIRRITENQTGIRNTHFKWAHIREMFVDPQIYLFVLLVALPSLSSGFVSFYSTTIIRNFGFSPKISALLNIPSGFLAIVACCVAAYIGRRFESRVLVFSCANLIGSLGAALLAFLPASKYGGALAGIYMINMNTISLYTIFVMVTANVAGQTKRIATQALITAVFSVGNIIGPQLFKAKDAPNYKPAKIIAFTTLFSASVVGVITRIYWGYQNKKRDTEEEALREQGALKQVTNLEWMNLTDIENKTFRYKY